MLISFDHSVNIVLAHVSAKFCGHKIKDERDISHFVLAIPAAPQSRCSRLAHSFPKIRYSVCQILLPIGVWWTCTRLCKLVCPRVPRWPSYKCHRNCYSSCPLSAAQLFYDRVFQPTVTQNDMPSCLNIPHIVPSIPTNWISFWFCDNHTTTHHNHRCLLMSTFWMHRWFAMFLSKPLHEPPNPLSYMSIIS
jgi:hypothetical protein